jgi:outer membrane protein
VLEITEDPMRTFAPIALIALALALAPVARAAETRIGFVDLRRAVSEIEEGKAAMAALKKDFEEKQKQLDAKQAELEGLRAEFEKQQAVLSDQVKQTKAVELDKRMGELRELYMQLQRDLSAREQEGMKGLLDRMGGLVKEIADAEGFQMVLEKSDAGVVWAQPSLDVTNELVRKYNTRYPKGAAAPAAPAAPKADPKAAPKPPAKKP